MNAFGKRLRSEVESPAAPPQPRGAWAHSKNQEDSQNDAIRSVPVETSPSAAALAAASLLMPACGMVQPSKAALHHPSVARLARHTSSERLVVVDTETTGTSNSRVVEIACVEIVGQTITGTMFHRLVNCGQASSVFAYRQHQLDDAFVVSEGSSPTDVYPALLRFLRGLLYLREDGGDDTLPPLAQLVCHNAAFDIAAINRELQLLANSAPNLVDGLCTMTIFRALYPNQPASLIDACKFFGIQRGIAHTAFGDAMDTAKLFLRLLAVVGDLDGDL